jgi:hypothetical protein
MMQTSLENFFEPKKLSYSLISDGAKINLLFSPIMIRLTRAGLSLRIMSESGNWQG